VIGAREQFRSRFRRALRQWGGHLKRTGRWEEAIHCFERGTEMSPLEETFYLELMECYQALGAIGDALRTFEQIRGLLLAHYGVAPSPALQSRRARLL
jgi:DNA-binding SARP family transcriptional activator